MTGDLKRFGYAPGDYQIICWSCDEIKTGLDKRATSCLSCAQAAFEASSHARNDDGAAEK